MQRWEYTTVLRNRGWQQLAIPGDKKGRLRPFVQGTNWAPDLESVFALGEEGWELVAVLAIANLMGGHVAQVYGAGMAESNDYAGFAGEQLWVFKRPKT